MLKKPCSNNNDLDLIISNLYSSDKVLPIARTNTAEQKSSNIINNGIEKRILPISMRKRLLYDIAMKA